MASPRIWKQQPWLFDDGPPNIDQMPWVDNDIEYDEIFACPTHGEFATNMAGAIAFITAELWVSGPRGPIRFGM